MCVCVFVCVVCVVFSRCGVEILLGLHSNYCFLTGAAMGLLAILYLRAFTYAFLAKDWFFAVCDSSGHFF